MKCKNCQEAKLSLHFVHNKNSMIKKILYYSALSGLMVSVLALSINFNSDINLLRFASAADPIPSAPESGGADLPPLSSGETISPVIPIKSIDGLNPNTPSSPDEGFSLPVSTKKPPVVSVDSTPMPDTNWQLKTPTKIIDSPENPTPEANVKQLNNNVSTDKPNVTPRSGGLEVGIVIGFFVIGFGLWYYYKNQHSLKSNLNIKEKKF